MKHWCKLQTALLNDHRLTKLPCEAQLAYYKLLHIAAICDAGGALIEADGEPVTLDTVAHYMRKDESVCRANIETLRRAGMVIFGDNKELIVTEYSSEKDTTATERKRAERERKRTEKKPPTDDLDDDKYIVTAACHGDMSRRHVTVTETETETETDEKRDKKNSSEQKPAAAAAESEFVKLWREWTIHTGPIAPTFKARIDETVTDLEVWRDTLTFGARNRRVKHTNDGLDWALSNYKTGIAQKRAAGMQTNGHALLTAMPKKKIMVEGVEVYI